jgi:hypothetical protein
MTSWVPADEYEAELEWRRCASDELHFLETYWLIKHPERGRIGFELRPAQQETLATWTFHRYTVALKARQIGFSTLAAAHSVWLAFFHPDRFIVMLSRAEREAIKLLAKAKYGYKFLPPWMLERGPTLLDDNQTRMSWDNDSAIESLPSASDPARGESVYLVIVDEWAFLPNSEEAWASIEPITDVGGRVVGISTANGSGTFFEDLYVKAKTGDNNFKPIFFPWSANTDRDHSWYDAKVRNMASTPWVLHQEYPRDDVECFIKSGMSVFDIDELGVMEAQASRPQRRGDLVPLARETGVTKAARFVENDAGHLQVWHMPIKDGRRYVIGADVAEGTEYGDFSVAHVIDTRTNTVVAKWRGHVPSDLFGSQVLWHIGWLYGGALIGVEINNMGIASALALQNQGYPNLYFRTTLDERTKKRQRKIGWRTTASTKPLMIAELAGAIRLEEAEDEDGRQLLSPSDLVVPDAETIAELKKFVREPDGKRMHGSPLDDQVISLAIANQMRPFALSSTQWKTEEVDPWSADGWSEWMDDQDNQDDEGLFVIGAHAVRRA